MEERRPGYQSRAAVRSNANPMAELLVVFCIMCRLGFPGNLAMVFGGERVNTLIDYGSSMLQVVLILIGSGATVMEIRLLDLKKKNYIIYLMLLVMFATSLLVSQNRVKQMTIIIRFSITALFGLWLADEFETEHLLNLIYLAQVGIVFANLLTLFVFRGAGFHYDDGYGYTFRGLYTQKNGLGGEIALGTVFQLSLMGFRRRRGERISISFLAILFVQIGLLLYSKATTATFCAVLALVYLWIYNHLPGKPLHLQWGILYTVVSIGFLFVAMTILPLFAPLLEAIGKDATLSNRTPMWQKIIDFMMENNTMTGYGLLQFWETPTALKALQSSYERNSWFRSMAYGAHSNLLEFWLDLGLVGLAMYFLTLVMCFRDVKYLTREQYILCTVIMIPILIGGLTDRQFTNTNSKTMFMFVMMSTACSGSVQKAELLRARPRRTIGAGGDGVETRAANPKE